MINRLCRSVVFAGALLCGMSGLALCSSSSAGAATLPSSVNYGLQVGQFGSYGNITSNDCSLAAIGALQQVWSAAVGGTGSPLPEAPVTSTYRSLAHGSDAGILPAQAFAAWEAGIGGRQIDSVGNLSTSVAATKAAIYALGGIYAVVMINHNDAQHPNVPTARWASVAPWTTTEPVRAGAASPEAHAVGVVGYDASYVYIVTWGSIQRVTWAWWTARVIQSWAILPATYFSLGHGPNAPLASLERTFFTSTAAMANVGPYAS